jgi:hypothetical protein
MEKIQEQIEILIKVQKIDAEIYRLKEEKSYKPAEKEALEKEFFQKGHSLKEKEENLKALQLKRKEREIDLEAKEKEIKKYQGQLYQVKTNKEYVSLQKEIELLKADNSVLEEDILISMEKIDSIKEGIAKEKEKLVEEERKLKAETTKIDQEIKSIEERISDLEKEREQFCADIEKKLLSQYERILKAKNGLALVPVVGESCGGCNRVLPPQVINETRMKDRVIVCEFCARLLYWPE